VFGRLVSHWKNRQFFVDSDSDSDEVVIRFWEVSFTLEE
jgi:hypothetical protein